MDIVNLLSTSIAAIGVFIAIMALWFQVRQNNLFHSADASLQLDKEFHRSDEMRRRRLIVARFLLKNKNFDTEPAEAADLLDFFDHLGLYHNMGVLSLEMIWITFFYWFAHYWQFLRPLADKYEQNAGGVLYYENSRQLYRKMYQYGSRYKLLPPESLYFTPDRLDAFLKEEIEQLSDNANS